MAINPVFFRQYDLRGIVDTHFSFSDVYELTHSILDYYKTQDPNLNALIVGMDGRIHSPEITYEVIRACTDRGIEVLYIGMCPTPVFYFSTHITGITSGIMITASHNPAQHNGFKLRLHKNPVWGVGLEQIRDHHMSKQKTTVLSRAKGIINKQDMIETYVNWSSIHFNDLKGLPNHLIFDCGNGTAGMVMRPLINTMKWPHAKLLYDKVDGTFPHHAPDPTVEENMKSLKDTVKSSNEPTVGIGFDGDCDRMDAMTESGKLLPGDHLLALFSKAVLEEHPNASIVYDVKSSARIIQLLHQWGAQGHLSACGHSIIKESMYSYNALLAGELSCHFFFKDRYFGFDDGLYAALRLIELLKRTGATLDQLQAILPTSFSSPEIRLTCAEEQKKPIIDHIKKSFASRTDTELITVDGARVHFEHGWGLIRPSNTSAQMCFRFEADTIDDLATIKKTFSELLEPFFDEQTLKETIEP